MRTGTIAAFRWFFAIFLGVLALGSGCRSNPERVRVAVSAFPIYDLTRKIAGPDADVVLLGQSSSEPLSGVHLGVFVGLGFDDAEEKRVRDAAPKAHILKVGDRVPTLSKSDRSEGPAYAIDPYVWLDPSRARLIVKAIGEELARLDRTHAIAFRQRATEVDAMLDALDKEVETKTAGWEKVEFSTDAKSFAYFADRYRIKISAPSGAAPAAADAAKIPQDALDPVGGGPERDSYEKMIRFNVAAFGRVAR